MKIFKGLTLIMTVNSCLFRALEHVQKLTCESVSWNRSILVNQINQEGVYT